MAKSPAGPGIYSPWNRRARSLIAQLRKAKHWSVQNAIMEELRHLHQKGSRRVRQAPGWLRRQAPQWGRKVAQAGRRQGGRAAKAVRAARSAPPMRCSCGQAFRSRLLFSAHARAHQREASRPQQGRQRASAKTARPGKGTRQTEAQRAQNHARDVIGAAGKPGRAAQARAKTAAATGQPVTARDLREMAKGTRATMPQSRTARAHASGRAMDPAVLKAARATPQTPASRAKSREQAILRRSLRSRDGAAARAASRTTPRVAPALKLAPAAPARAPRAPRSAPVRPGRTT
jgi:hypothetical protein